MKEGTGRVVRFDLIPLEELGRPRVDVLASLSGIFRYVICDFDQHVSLQCFFKFSLSHMNYTIFFLYH